MPGMSLRRSAASLLVCLLLPAVSAAAQNVPAPAAPATAGEPLTVMSFNIRYGTADDGANAWPLRRGILFDLLREQRADLIGLQEALDFQIDEIVEAVPGYAVIGVGRDDGGDRGELSAILFRADRLRVAEAGTFWFSDEPGVPGSKSWGNTITRICTWARLVDGDGRGFYLYNLHLDHQSQPSREKSTALLRARIEARAVPGDPVVVTGDFNAGERNPALTALTGATDGTAAFLVDTYRVLHPDAADVGTFSGFKFGTHGPEKIDYVLVQPGTEVLQAAIVRDARDSRYPSDHFPVTARIRFP
jgi:endonuclease/exonuclease/phosphatase family metal-dependent hydrolase